MPVILLQVVLVVTFAALLAVVPPQAWYLRALAILTGIGIRRESRLGSRLNHSSRIRICVLLPCGCMLHHCTCGSPTYSTRVCRLSVSLGQMSGCSLARFLILTRLQSRCWWGLCPQLRPLHPLLGSLSWYVCWQNSLPCSCVAEALGSVAINEDQMGTRKDHLFRAFNSKGVGHHYLHLAGTQRQVEGRESLTMEQRGSFRSGVPRLGPLDWGDWMQLTSCGWLGSLLASAWSHIGNQDKIRRLSVINQVLIVLSKGVLTSLLSYNTSSGHFGSVVTGVMVLLPGPVARGNGLISYRSDLYMAADFLVAIGGFTWTGCCRLWVRVLLLPMAGPPSVCSVGCQLPEAAHGPLACGCLLGLFTAWQLLLHGQQRASVTLTHFTVDKNSVHYHEETRGNFILAKLRIITWEADSWKA